MSSRKKMFSKEHKPSRKWNRDNGGLTFAAKGRRVQLREKKKLLQAPESGEIKTNVISSRGKKIYPGRRKK